MSVRIYGSSLLRLSARQRPFRPLTHTQSRFFSMADAGVTTQELEEAIKSRLQATHAQVTDISGALPHAFYFHLTEC
jgi:hypothetical protein